MRVRFDFMKMFHFPSGISFDQEFVKLELFQPNCYLLTVIKFISNRIANLPETEKKTTINNKTIHSDTSDAIFIREIMYCDFNCLHWPSCRTINTIRFPVCYLSFKNWTKKKSAEHVLNGWIDHMDTHYLILAFVDYRSVIMRKGDILANWPKNIEIWYTSVKFITIIGILAWSRFLLLSIIFSYV